MHNPWAEWIWNKELSIKRADDFEHIHHILAWKFFWSGSLQLQMACRKPVVCMTLAQDLGLLKHRSLMSQFKFGIFESPKSISLILQITFIFVRSHHRWAVVTAVNIWMLYYKGKQCFGSSEKQEQQEALQECKPPPRLVWRAWNSLLKRETV